MHPHADPYTGLSVDSPAFRQRATRVQLSDDPDTATAETVQEMCRQIHTSAPSLRPIAADAVRTIRGGPAWLGSGIAPFSNPQVMAESCWWWAKHYMRFKHHGSMFEVWSADLGDPHTKLQLLIAPDVLVRMRRMEGDCAIYTMMLAALLESLGLRWEICTAAVDRSQPLIFSHVWPRVVLSDGRRESLDASHGQYPGWQVPARDIHRLRVWDDRGRMVGDQGPRFSGLHGYRTRRGMGEPIQQPDGTYIDDGYVPPSADNPTQVFGPNVGSIQGFPSSMQPSYTAPSRSSTDWGTFAAQLMKGGLTLAEINSIQPGTVVSASGAILRQSPGYAVPVGSPVTALGGSSNILLYAGVGIALLFGFSMMSGRK